MALQQHFDNTRCRAKIAVNLEGGMGVKQIGVQPPTGIVEIDWVNQCK